jgi:acetyltransferase-like isoleucine patch superfamily enzyme
MRYLKESQILSNGTFVHESAYVDDSAVLGINCKVWINAQIRDGAIIGEGTIIGKDVYIDHGVQVGKYCKIQNGVSIYKGVVLGDNVFVGPHVTFTNDLYPRAFKDEWSVTPTVLENGVSVGANSTVICGVTISEYSLIGAGSVVTKSVPPFSLVLGNPGRVIGRVGRDGVPLGGEH